ncbi:hypothetical protein AB0912_26230 [Streptomyces sp. NPDC007084]|uniref:hypothetical protein n=1 Tax=Streptomyces sp. NPDC007084 TaxID=3154313 RepID=UPI003452AAEE
MADDRLSRVFSALADPTRRDIVITREFDAPPERVFRAHTEPDLVVQWLGPRRLTLRVEVSLETAVFVHAWDLARASGQDEALDPGGCARLLDGMLPLDQVLRESGQYGPRVEVPGSAGAQTRLLAFIGRTP